jgi:uncharacterized protein (DUF2235 family)
MAKNILIFSDGTGQAGGLRPDQRLSNIYKLYRATRVGPDNCIDPDKQVAFYDSGLGTAESDDPLWVRPWTTIQKWFASATGTGIGRNVSDCYSAIIARYEPGDRIYLFGFSRGGYTVRCLAHVIALCGIPTKDGKGNPVPLSGSALRTIADEAVYQVYDHATGKKNEAYVAERAELARRFREKYDSADPSRPDKANVAPYFIGCFDAVAALGMRPWMRIVAFTVAGAALFGVANLLGALAHAIFGWTMQTVTLVSFAATVVFIGVKLIRWHVKRIWDFPMRGSFRAHVSLMRFSRDEADTHFDNDVLFGRHALAIDERRYDFGRVVWGSSKMDTEGAFPSVPRFRQIWFAGNHSDIGGSYPEDESRLSDIPLAWMIEQTEALPEPVIFDYSKLNLFPRPDGMQHCEVESFRQGLPSWIPERFRFSWKADIRASASGAPRHKSVDERLALGAVQNLNRKEPYRPPALYLDPDHGPICQTPNEHCLPKDWRERWAKVQQKAKADVGSTDSNPKS